MNKTGGTKAPKPRPNTQLSRGSHAQRKRLHQTVGSDMDFAYGDTNFGKRSSAYSDGSREGHSSTLSIDGMLLAQSGLLTDPVSMMHSTRSGAKLQTIAAATKPLRPTGTTLANQLSGSLSQLKVKEVREFRDSLD